MVAACCCVVEVCVYKGNMSTKVMLRGTLRLNLQSLIFRCAASQKWSCNKITIITLNNKYVGEVKGRSMDSNFLLSSCASSKHCVTSTASNRS